ncbi:enoyl-CoA hydratase/isomerase family protein [Microbacterium jejuense]|uniref:enoyl-CoA hydratase/isomerase family protein n=1 Tax=Microbacterium jejuense TaxID=1263637 RepID=UPI0031EF4EEE
MTDDRLDALPRSEDLLLGRSGSSLIVTLNRPSRANALTESMMDDLRSLWREVAAARWVRSVIITGAGTAFCAGADAGMLAQPRTRIGRDAAEELSFVPGPHLDVPVIVAVNGVCAGGGLHFVADADLCIAADTARFVDPHVTVGQVSGMEPVELMLKARRDVVVRMALLGRSEMLDADRAKEVGLVSEVVPLDALPAHVAALGERIAEGSPEAVRATRAVIRDFEADVMRRHMDAGWKAVQDHWAHPDAHEGPRAFLEKRTPRWAETD